MWVNTQIQDFLMEFPVGTTLVLGIFKNIYVVFLISDFRRDLNNVYFLLGISPASNCQFDAGEIRRRKYTLFT